LVFSLAMAFFTPHLHLHFTRCVPFWSVLLFPATRYARAIFLTALFNPQFIQTQK
jgi:hypothetical protein